ncbi:DinB family protein [Rhodococcus sp. NPDC060176]|uniref:DinB family protein n=1 Tax=Rhodococcus sp. NPDC060176 TaxID=3347062 RepID=UPI00365CB9B9
MPITPDTKNWTWVLERPCTECGFDSSSVAFTDVPDLVRANAASWAEVLERENVTVRPDSETWSALEYSAHVRDVFRIFKVRLEQMLEFDDPRFENWDQDATAEAERYNDQDPATVASELSDAAAEIANAFETVPEGGRQRRGLRSDGSAFTVESLAAYFIHDPIHHLNDVSA